MTTPAIFLDRDGTIIEERGFISDPEQVVLEKNAGDGMREMLKLGWPVLVATNQSGIARRLMTERDVEAVHLRMIGMLAAEGARVNGIYYCPHHPDGDEPVYTADCDCRKPGPGLLEQGAREHGIDLEESYMIGDSERDLQAGRAVDATTILVLTGNGRKTLGEGPGHKDADYIAADLLDAAKWIAEQAAT